MVYQESFSIQSSGRETLEISERVQACVANSEMQKGLCNIFIHHTSASLILCENADASVRSDLERYMQRLVVDGDPLFEHTAEGADDMPAHIRSILTSSSISVPIANGRVLLGTWQGIYLWEHRYRSHARKVTVTIYGE